MLPRGRDLSLGEGGCDVIGVVSRVGAFQLVQEIIGTKLGRRPVKSSSANSRFRSWLSFLISVIRLESSGGDVPLRAGRIG